MTAEESSSTRDSARREGRWSAQGSQPYLVDDEAQGAVADPVFIEVPFSTVAQPSAAYVILLVVWGLLIQQRPAQICEYCPPAPDEDEDEPPPLC
mmetsp:Transcript_31240/g.74173  ORF Transcript_31240/g.74173 Transcript_31240/m.74173 type:complete len:95 (+) Transcript_31240:33-317(+)